MTKEEYARRRADWKKRLQIVLGCLDQEEMIVHSDCARDLEVLAGEMGEHHPDLES
jgi:hypothetical protein